MARKNLIEFKISAVDNASHQLQAVRKNVSGLSGDLSKLAGLTVGGLGISEIAKQADIYRLLQNRLRLVTKSTEELNAVTEALTVVSIRSRSSFQSTADLYARVARSSRTLGLSQQELLDFTETVTKSIRISGSTSQEAAAGVIQFGQALASSRLSGDELRSVLEQMPRLAQAIAEGMGVGIGRLREMGEAGDLTAKAVLDALRKAAPDIAKEFDKLKPLVSEAFSNLNTALLVTIGKLDEMSGMSEVAAGFILDLADQVLLFGDAVTGQLEPTDELSEGLQRVAVAAVVAAGTLEILKSSLVSTTSVGAKLFLESGASTFAKIAARIRGDTDELIDSIEDDFQARWKEGFGVQSFRDMLTDLQLDVNGIIDTILPIMNPGLRPTKVPVDLTGKSPAAVDMSKSELAALKAASTSLIKMRDALILQNKAVILAKESGMDFAEALQRVKVEALGVASFMPEIANQVQALIDALDVNQDDIALNAVIDDLSDRLILLGKSARDAAIATELDKLFSAGTPSDNQIDEVVRMAGELFDDVPGKVIAMNDVLDDLSDRLVKVGMSARDAAIATELDKLFAAGTPSEIQVLDATRMAGELFDIEAQLSASLTFMESLVEQTARNMQDSLADFFFEPFSKGLDGMLLDFLNVVRRMLAELAAFETLKFFFTGTSLEQFIPNSKAVRGVSGGSGAETLNLGGLAAGGPTLSGRPVLVGENGPEIFIPGASGSIMNNSASKASMGGGMQFTTNIDARGADPGLIARLPQIMEQRDRKLMLQVQRLLEDGSIMV